MSYIALDDPMLAGQYGSMTADQWHHLYPMAILDEVQKLPGIIDSIKAVYDKFDDSRYILTGSSQLLLLSKVRESHAGRSIILELFPLTLPEMLTNDWKEDIVLSFFQKYIKSLKLPEMKPSFLMEPDFAKREEVFRYFLEFGGYPALADPGHYLDPGVQRAVIQKRGALTGNEFESAVVAEIYKQTLNISCPVSFYHLRTVDGREVDLLLETENGYIAIEIKMSQNINKTDTRHLAGLANMLDKPLLQSFILSNDNSIKYPDNGVIAIPAAMFLT
jgi:predicted AAA+ superfamily ATPase